jgi:hypothetical protein
MRRCALRIELSFRFVRPGANDAKSQAVIGSRISPEAQARGHWRSFNDDTTNNPFIAWHEFLRQ